MVLTDGFGFGGYTITPEGFGAKVEVQVRETHAARVFYQAVPHIQWGRVETGRQLLPNSDPLRARVQVVESLFSSFSSVRRSTSRSNIMKVHATPPLVSITTNRYLRFLRRSLSVHVINRWRERKPHQIVL